MNKPRRKRIVKLIEKINEIQVLIEEAKAEAEEITEEEQEALDNLPESLQESERGEAMQTAIDNLSEAMDSLEEFDAFAIIESLESAME